MSSFDVDWYLYRIFICLGKSNSISHHKYILTMHNFTILAYREPNIIVCYTDDIIGLIE